MSEMRRRSTRETWRVLAELLGTDFLAGLAGIPAATAQHYMAGDRATPDGVAARLYWIELIVADLAGSYNEFGIRRWFVRARTQLDNKPPAQVLAGDWSPSDPGPRTVRAMAGSLVDAAAT
jgi:hypothetical protein